MVETCAVDSPLGSWSRSVWVPSAGDPLAGLVERIWDFDGTLAYRRERLFPTGFIEIVAQLDEPHRPVSDTARDPFPALCVDGLATTTSTIEAPAGACRVLALSLHPCGAFALLGTSLADLRDRNVDLRAVIGRAAAELGESLFHARDGIERVRIAERWARERLHRATGADPLVATVARRIDRVPNRAIRDIGELMGRSRSRLAAAFADQVGLTPKRYARVVRFRRTLALLGAERTSLSELAATCGYYDQAHLTNEFRAHAGMSPRAYAEALRFPTSSHLAELS